MNIKNHVTRLSKYKSALTRLTAIGMNRVFAENLADAVGVSSAQVRKDFSIFGIMGNKRGGYRADELITQIENLLGRDKENPVIIIGFGNIGRALVQHHGFKKDNLRIVAAFDVDKDVLAQKHEIPVMDIDEIGDYVKKYHIRLAVLTVPDLVAQETMDILADCGIEGVLNFSSLQLRAPEHVFINNIDLELALETIIFYLKSPVKEIG